MQSERGRTFIEALLALPFPAEESTAETREGRIASGPGFHIASVATSDDFWDDEDGSRSRAAYAELDTLRSGLVEALSEAWGPPRRERFWPSPGPLGVELLNSWGLDAADIWVRGDRVCCVEISQVDKEFAMELVVAVGSDPGTGRP
jgi:hypothetical protein